MNCLCFTRTHPKTKTDYQPKKMVTLLLMEKRLGGELLMLSDGQREIKISEGKVHVQHHVQTKRRCLTTRQGALNNSPVD